MWTPPVSRAAPGPSSWPRVLRWAPRTWPGVPLRGRASRGSGGRRQCGRGCTSDLQTDIRDFTPKPFYTSCDSPGLQNYTFLWASYNYLQVWNSNLRSFINALKTISISVIVVWDNLKPKLNFLTSFEPCYTKASSLIMHQTVWLPCLPLRKSNCRSRAKIFALVKFDQ